jgi:hypothetical protein
MGRHIHLSKTSTCKNKLKFSKQHNTQKSNPPPMQKRCLRHLHTLPPTSQPLIRISYRNIFIDSQLKISIKTNRHSVTLQSPILSKHKLFPIFHLSINVILKPYPNTITKKRKPSLNTQANPISNITQVFSP